MGNLNGCQGLANAIVDHMTVLHVSNDDELKSCSGCNPDTLGTCHMPDKPRAWRNYGLISMDGTPSPRPKTRE